MSFSINDKAVERGTELLLDQALEGATTDFPPSVQQVVVGGVVYGQDDLKKKIQSFVARWKDARKAKAALRQFGQDKPRLEEDVAAFLTQLKAAMVAHYGHESETLTRFGFKPAKRRRELTVEENALRAAKARLTREKRGTKGKKQREAIVTKETPSVSITPDGHMTAIEGSNEGAPRVTTQ